MKTFWLVREQYVLFDPETVFEFFSDASNLELLTPPWLHFEIRTPGQIEMREGTLIDYKLRLRGIPIQWQSEITAWEPSSRFVDEQRKGPYRLWVHEHVFEPLGSGTLVRDAVEYAVPGETTVERLLVRPDLERIFDFRAQKLEEWAKETLKGNAIRAVEQQLRSAGCQGETP